MEILKNKKQWVSPQFIGEDFTKTNSGTHGFNAESTTTPGAVTYYAPIS